VRSPARRGLALRGLVAGAALVAIGVAAAVIGTPGTQPTSAREAKVRPLAATASAVALPNARRFPTATAIHHAIAYLRSRDRDAALAVVDSRGTLYGYRSNVTFTSASVVKVMLLVQYLRTHGTLSANARATLTLMITRSDNTAAYRVYATVGERGLQQLATLTGMLHFRPGANVLYSRITATDQARFFFDLDRYLPRAHRRFGRYLLSHVVRSQTWGVAEVARPRWRVFFKSGWFGAAEDPYTLVNQVARLERGDLTWSLAVLSDDNPHSPYAFETLRGVTRRLLASTSRD
jgi:hypothetical protein